MFEERVFATCKLVCAGSCAACVWTIPALVMAQTGAPMDDIESALASDQREREETRSSSTARPSPESPPRGGGAQSMNPDISLIGNFALGWFSEDENLQGGGHDPEENGFTLQQLELAFSTVVDPYFRFDGNIVFGLFGVEVEEAYATTLDLPAQLQARAGQFLTRFGRLNSTHLHAWHFVDQPFALTRVFGGEGGRGLGLELSWLSPLPWFVELVGSVTNASGEETARSFLGDSDFRIEDPRGLLYVAAVKQFFPLSDDWSLSWGISGAFGPNATGHHNRTDVFGTDVYLKWRPITYASELSVVLQTEWMYRRRHVAQTTIQDLNGYAYLFMQLSKQWGGGVRYELGTAAYELGFTRTVDYLDPDWTGERQRFSANATYAPTEFSRFRLQGSADVPHWLDEPIWAGFLTLELVTGAHGAHTF